MRNGQLKNGLILAREFLADILFPRRCVGCDTPGEWLCPSCTRGIPIHTQQECFVCRQTKTPSGEPCFACRGKTALDGVFVAAPFRGSALAEAIHVYKYEFVDELASPLGALFADALSRSAVPLPNSILPVPLHPWRLRFRGFNQSFLLANELGSHLTPGIEIPVLERALIRRRFTLPQARMMNALERKRNLSGAFALGASVTKETFRGKTLWLVDDVMTTGSTLEECARVLKKSGAKKIFGVVLAR